MANGLRAEFLRSAAARFAELKSPRRPRPRAHGRRGPALHAGPRVEQRGRHRAARGREHAVALDGLPHHRRREARPQPRRRVRAAEGCHPGEAARAVGGGLGAAVRDRRGARPPPTSTAASASAASRSRWWTPIQRQLTHYGEHVGQIVYIAKHRKWRTWESLEHSAGRGDHDRHATARRCRSAGAAALGARGRSRRARGRGGRRAGAARISPRRVHVFVLALPHREVPDREGHRRGRRARFRRRGDPAPPDGERDARLRERAQAGRLPQRAWPCPCSRSTRTSCRPDPAERQKDIEHTKHCIELAAQLGAPAIRLNSGRWNTIKSFDDLMKVKGEEPPIAGHTEDEAFDWVKRVDRGLPARGREGRRAAGAGEPLGPDHEAGEPAADLQGRRTRPGS